MSRSIWWSGNDDPLYEKIRRIFDDEEESVSDNEIIGAIAKITLRTKYSDDCNDSFDLLKIIRQMKLQHERIKEQNERIDQLEMELKETNAKLDQLIERDQSKAELLGIVEHVTTTYVNNTVV